MSVHITVSYVLKTRIQEALSGIDAQLKRRTDLIPNLVETVKGYAKNEKSVLRMLAKGREAHQGSAGGSLQEKADANNQLSTALEIIALQ